LHLMQIQASSLGVSPFVARDKDARPLLAFECPSGVAGFPPEELNFPLGGTGAESLLGLNFLGPVRQSAVTWLVAVG